MSETHEDVVRRRFLDRAWRSFTGDGVEVDGVSDDIVRSWRRARELGVDPTQRRCSRLLSPVELEERRERDETYRLSRSILDDFGSRLVSSEQVLAYFDPAGWMLSIGGNPRTAERVAAINFCPGANWLEETAGTNGPGTALAEHRPVEVFASEHFVEAWQAWSCSAAPVLAHGSGELLGLVDLTGPWAAHDVRSLVAARAIAHAFEERLRSAHLVREQVVEYAFRMAAGTSDALFAVDQRGRVLAANDAARRRLAFEGLEIPSAIRQFLEPTLRQRITGQEAVTVDCPGLLGNIKLLASPVRYEQTSVGAVVRVLAAPTRPRGSARTCAPQGSATTRYDFEHVLGESECLGHAVLLARTASRNDLPVVLFGESGTGKELFAQAIHSASPRGGCPFIAVNCGCIPGALLEAELFGYEAGTFTGGRRDGNAGKFEEADGGTLFLDEVSELSPQAQTALLRVLQEREVVRLGGSSPRRVDIRVIAASNKCLPDEVTARRFRTDLFFRLNVLTITVPPLRERLSDIGHLARVFLFDAQAEVKRTGLAFSEEALLALEAYSWPGNVRELRNFVLRVAATAPNAMVEFEDLPAEVREAVENKVHAVALNPPGGALALPTPVASLASGSAATLASPGDPNREALLRALEAASWNVARTAQALQISRMTLYRWLRKYGIER